MKLTITKIYRSFKDKNNNPLKTKDGREYERVAIQTKEYGSKWVSGFGARDNQNWKADDVVDVEIEQKGEYINFKRLDPIKLLEARVTALEQMAWVTKQEPENAPQGQETGNEGDIIHDSDVPF